MTTVAYRGGVMAADCASQINGTMRRVRKIARVMAPDGTLFLVGCCGDSYFTAAVLACMAGAAQRPDPADFPSLEENGFSAIVVSQDGRIWQMSQCAQYLPIREEFHAIGSGQQFAWGAMDAGASAVQAVGIAARRSPGTGLFTESVRF